MRKSPAGNIAIFITAILILLFTSGWSLYSSRQLSQHVNLLQSSTAFLDNLQALENNINLGVIYYRNFILTGQSEYDSLLIAEDTKRKELLHKARTFEEQEDRPNEDLKMLKEIEALTQQQFDYFKNSMEVNVSKENVSDSLLISYVNRGSLLTVAIQEKITTLINNENSFVNNRGKTIKSYSNNINTINFLTGLLAILFMTWAGFSYLKENTEKNKALEEGEVYKQQLEKKITDLNNANKTLEELKDEEKYTSAGRIARVIAHEVKNPITNINLAVDELEENLAGNDDNEMMIDIIKRNSTRINTLISNLMNATKFLELKFENRNIHDILDLTLEMAKDRIDFARAEIVVNYNASKSVLPIDEEKLKIAFLNIIINALEAMKDNREKGKEVLLKIETLNMGEEIRIIFKDNGLGMDAKILKTIFEAFYTKKDQGSGLGLTNTRNIIRTHGGKIYVESQPGKGSTFFVSFPVA